MRQILNRVPSLMWWSLPFIGVEVALITYGFSTFHLPFGPLLYAEPLRLFLIGANLTIAAFAVNFSLLSVQLSPYRAALRGLTPRLVSSAALTLLLALTPIITAAFSERWMATSALLALPILAYTVVVLSVLTRSQSSAKPYIRRLAKEKNLITFGEAFRDSARKLDATAPEFELKDGTPPPVHELGWRIYPVAVDPDPISELCTIAALAADSGDLTIYVESVIALLKSLDFIHGRSFPMADEKDSTGLELLRQHSINGLNRVAAMRPAWDATGIVAHRFNHTCSAFLSTNDFSVFPRSALALSVVSAMKQASKPLIELDIDQPAVDVVVVARRIALYQTKREQADDSLIAMQHRHILAGHARMMQELGEASIVKRNTHLLYRCLDGLGFLGCSAAKSDNAELGTACMLGLVQLGRLARKESLPCFWDRCALLPDDHAEERIEWITSWTTHLVGQRRERWGRSVNDALSRVRGLKTLVQYLDTDDGCKYAIERTNDPYIYTVIENGRVRSYNFSDINMVRELVIH